MLNPVELPAKPREITGKGPNRRLRAQGEIPAVVYGTGKEPRALTVDPRTVAQILNDRYGKNTILHLKVDGEETPRLAIVRDYQVHAWKRRLLHVDFWEITPETELLLTVPLARVGKAKVEAVGGRIQIIRNDVQIRCLPANIPASIDVDVTPLDEDVVALAISAVPMPEGVQAVFKQDYNILRVKSAKAASAEAAADAAEAAAASAAAAAPAAAEKTED